MNNKQDKGFTLVELLIVIVILGILATVTVFAVRGITDRGQQNACAVEKRTLDTAVEAFYAQEQRDPTVAVELTTGPYVTPIATPPVFRTGGQPMLKNPPSAGNWSFAGPPAAFTAITKANGGKCV